jgi:hypothetical protein
LAPPLLPLWYRIIPDSRQEEVKIIFGSLVFVMFAQPDWATFHHVSLLV